jgi:hypothetical protein
MDLGQPTLDVQMSYGVMITSAINTKFGVYDGNTRLDQTLATIASVRERIPGCTVFVLEMTGAPLTDTQRNALAHAADHLLDFTTDANVVGLYNSTDNWDVVKNVTEVMCFGNALKAFRNSGNLLNEFQRVFKISGRYTLDDRFDLSFYDEYKNQNMIVLGTQKPSQFPVAVTQSAAQHMSRLWSWPTALNDEIIDFYDKSLNFMYERLAAGGYIDIEHCLYRFLDHNKILEKDSLGILGNIAPNGVAIKD